MGQRHKCTYYGMRLVSGKLYVIAEWDRYARPFPLRHPGGYSKQWNWGEQSGKEAYDLAYAMILHTFRGYPGRELVANRYAIPYAEDVLWKLPTDGPPSPMRGASTPLFRIDQDEVHDWVQGYEERFARQNATKEALLAQIRNYR